MKSLLSLVITLSLLALISTYPAPDPCRWTDPNTGDSYDFSSLNRAQSYAIRDYSIEAENSLFSIDYVFNFCKPMPLTCNSVGNLGVFEVLEVMGQLTEECQVMGTLEQMDVVTGTSLGYPGVKITYKGGQKCTSSDNPAQDGQPMYTTFNIICGEAGSNFEQLNYNGETITKCTPEFYIQHPAGCVGGVYNAPGSAASSSSGFFHWIIIILIVFVVGGIIYNMKMQNKKGLDALSHIAFWKYISFASLKEVPITINNYSEKIMKMIKQRKNPAFVTGGLTTSNQKLTGGNNNAKYTLV